MRDPEQGTSGWAQSTLSEAWEAIEPYCFNPQSHGVVCSKPNCHPSTHRFSFSVTFCDPPEWQGSSRGREHDGTSQESFRGTVRALWELGACGQEEGAELETILRKELAFECRVELHSCLCGQERGWVRYQIGLNWPFYFLTSKMLDFGQIILTLQASASSSLKFRWSDDNDTRFKEITADIQFPVVF